MDFAEEIGYPVIVRPAFTLGGSGGGIAENAGGAARNRRERPAPVPYHTRSWWRSASPAGRKSSSRSCGTAAGNVITVCSMENFDPVGVHTGDSIVIAPAVTLADKEYQMLRSAALRHHHRAGGGGRLQLPVRPEARTASNTRSSRSIPGCPAPPPWPPRPPAIPSPRWRRKSPSATPSDEIHNAVTGKHLRLL